MTGSFADQFEDDFGPAPTKDGLAKAAAQPQALQAGSDRERDEGHKLWLVLNDIENQVITQETENDRN